MRYFIQSLLLLLLIAGYTEGALAEEQASTDIISGNEPKYDPLQIKFLEGAVELQKGNYTTAAGIFREILTKSNSPRVKLELARALFLCRRYRESGKLFHDVLLHSGIPWSVQENIRLYLKEIDSVSGEIKFGLSIVTDSNPRNFTNSRQVKIAGQTLTLQSPSDNKEVIGLRYSLNGAKALSDDGRFIGYSNIAFSDFGNSQFDRWVGDLGLLYSFEYLPKLRVKAGIEESFFAGRHLYEFPYIGLIFTPDSADQFRLNSEFKIGELLVPDADYLDAKNLLITTNISRHLKSDVLLAGDFSFEKSLADEDAYSYHGGAIGLNLSIPFAKDWGVKLSGSIRRRLYEGSDPFFGDTRRDTFSKIGITLANKRLNVFGYSPEIGVTYEMNRSSLEYFKYDKLGLVFSINQL